MQSPYSAARRDDPKETVFERVRAQSYPELPGRLKALFVFDDPAHVIRAQSTWFKDDPRDALECRLFSNAIRHRADSVWLNARPEDWERNAHQYWQGAMTAQPLPEVVVCGGIYFPGWESFPDAMA